MTQYLDSGNYTCSVENVHGRDEVTYSVEVKVPPQPPVLAVVDSYADSLHLQWSDQGDGGSPILGKIFLGDKVVPRTFIFCDTPGPCQYIDTQLANM